MNFHRHKHVPKRHLYEKPPGRYADRDVHTIPGASYSTILVFQSLSVMFFLVSSVLPWS